jgi:hypothetical protein
MDDGRWQRIGWWLVACGSLAALGDDRWGRCSCKDEAFAPVVSECSSSYANASPLSIDTMHHGNSSRGMSNQRPSATNAK